MQEQEPFNLLRAAEKPVLKLPQKTPFIIGKIFLYLFIFIITIGVVGGAFYLSNQSKIKTAYSQNSSTILEPKKFSFFDKVKNFFFGEEEITLTGHEQDRINVLVLGMGGAGHDGPYLTDTNMIISIKPSTKEVAMISIPRDLGVNIPGYGIRKINQVNSIGEGKNKGEGAEFTREFFSKTFNIDIPYYIRVDFKAFSELVDSVGGVDINVERSFTDNTYPNGEKELGANCVGENESSSCRYLKAEFFTGDQHMDGRTALIYSRSRHGNNGEGSDFARARRQQKVLSALKGKILSAGTYTNPITIGKIISSLSGHITTNLEIKDMLEFASLAKNINTTEIKTLVLDTNPNGFLTPASLAILAPRTGNFSAINSAIETIFDSNSSTIHLSATSVFTNPRNITPLPNTKIEVQNGTWHAGLASRIKKRLQELGLSVSSIGNSVKRPIDTTTIYVLKPLPEDVSNLLSKELKAVSTTTLPSWLSEETDETAFHEKPFQPDTDVLIILGNDLQNQVTLN